MLSKILQAVQVKVGKVEGLAVEHAQMIQFDCSDWAFVKSRVDANGVWLLPTVDGVDFIKPALAATADHTLFRSTAGSPQAQDAISADEAYWKFSSQGLPKGLDVAAWDVKQQALSKEVSAQPFSLGSGGLDPAQLEVLATDVWTWIHSLALAGDEQAAASDARMLAQQVSGVQARFTVMGSTAFQPGQTLALSGYGAHFDGSGIITEVRHTMSTGTWRTDLVLGQDTQRDVGAPLVPSVCGLHIGIVDTF
jgi:phage protein D